MKQLFQLAALAVLWCATVSDGAVIVQNFEMEPQSDSWNHTFSVQQFNSAQGHLESVQIKIYGNIAGNLGVENIEDKFNYISGTIGSTFGAYLPSEQSAFVSLYLAGTGSVVRDPFDGQLDYGGQSGYTFSLSTDGDRAETYLDDPTFSLFVGTGIVPIEMVALHFSSATAGEGTPIQNASFSSLGKMEITYTYGEVPEPTSLLFTGLIGAAIYLRTRRPRVHPARGERQAVMPAPAPVVDAINRQSIYYRGPMS